MWETKENEKMFPLDNLSISCHYLDMVTLSWVELCPPRFVEALASSTCECDLFWNKGLCKCNLVKMRSYSIRVGPKSTPRCPHKKRLRHRHPLRSQGKMEADLECWVYSHQKVLEETRRGPPLEHSERA